MKYLPLLILSLFFSLRGFGAEPIHAQLFLVLEETQDGKVTQQVRFAQSAFSTLSGRVTYNKEPLRLTYDSDVATLRALSPDFPLESICVFEITISVDDNGILSAKYDIDTPILCPIRTQISLLPGKPVTLGGVRWRTPDGRALTMRWELKLEHTPEPVGMTDVELHDVNTTIGKNWAYTFSKPRPKGDEAPADPFAPAESQPTDHTSDMDYALLKFFESAGIDFDSTPGSGVTFSGNRLYLRHTPEVLAELRQFMQRYEQPRQTQMTSTASDEKGDIELFVTALSGRVASLTCNQPELLGIPTINENAGLEMEITTTVYEDESIVYWVELHGRHLLGGDDFNLRGEVGMFAGASATLAKLSRTADGQPASERSLQLSGEFVPVVEPLDVPLEYGTRFYPVSAKTVRALSDASEKPRDPFAPNAADAFDPNMTVDERGMLKKFYERQGILNASDPNASFAYDGTQIIARQTPENHRKMRDTIRQYQYPKNYITAYTAQVNNSTLAVEVLNLEGREADLTWVDKEHLDAANEGIEMESKLFAYDDQIDADTSLVWTAPNIGRLETVQQSRAQDSTQKTTFLPALDATEPQAHRVTLEISPVPVETILPLEP